MPDFVSFFVKLPYQESQWSWFHPDFRPVPNQTVHDEERIYLLGGSWLRCAVVRERQEGHRSFVHACVRVLLGVFYR